MTIDTSPKNLRALADLDARAGEPLGKALRALADEKEALTARADKAERERDAAIAELGASGRREGVAIARAEAAEAEAAAQKRRADNHWETLRSIRSIARETGDLPRIIQWVNDAGVGYLETAEATLSQEMDRRMAAEAKLAKARKALDKIAGGRSYADDPWGIAKGALDDTGGE